MKRILALILSLVILLSLPACGSKNTAKNDNNVGTVSAATKDTNTDTNTDTSVPTAKGNYKDFKTGLTNFVTDYTNAKKPFYDEMDKSSDKNTYIMDSLALYTGDLVLAFVPMFDTLDPMSDGPKVTGKMMLSGFDGFKEKDGSLLKFGSSHTYDKESGAYKVGDKTASTGYLDVDKKLLTEEDTTESGGSKTARSISEIKLLSDGTYLVQEISSSTTENSGVFLNFDGKKFTAVIATSASNVNFNYTSLADAGNISAQDMAKDMKASLIITIEDGKVTYEKKQ